MDADTQKLWADDNRDPYLRLFVLSASKVRLSHVDPVLVSFAVNVEPRF